MALRVCAVGERRGVIKDRLGWSGRTILAEVLVAGIGERRPKIGVVGLATAVFDGGVTAGVARRRGAIKTFRIIDISDSGPVRYLRARQVVRCWRKNIQALL